MSKVHWTNFFSCCYKWYTFEYLAGQPGYCTDPRHHIWHKSYAARRSAIMSPIPEITIWNIGKIPKNIAPPASVFDTSKA